MKTKPITLIVSLLFCLSGSAFAEDEKSNDSSNDGIRHELNHLDLQIKELIQIKNNNQIIIEQINNKLDKIIKQLNSPCLLVEAAWESETNLINKNKIKNLKTALYYCYRDTGYYPDDEEGLNGLLVQQDGWWMKTALNICSKLNS